MTVQQRTSWILQTIDAQDPPLRASYSPLPARDAFEQDRLVTQHYVLRTAFDDQDYQAPMQPMLDQGCVALEIGCGPGTWSMEMSTAFPESTFIGLDLDTCFPNFIKPKNCHFRKCDITQLPLPLPDNSVDYIFHRDMNWALLAIQWPLLVKEYLRILRPGGWIECMEMDVETQSSRRLEQYINDHLMHSLRQRGQDPSIAKRLPSLLAIQGFRRVSSQFQSLPLGWGKAHQGKSQKRAHANTSSHPTPHNSSNSSNSSNSANSAAATTLPTCSEFARAAGSLHTYTLQSLRPWLASNMACSLEKYDAWLERVPAEWADAHTYVNWHAVVAQKPF
ncbi:S-adenosyl-L-methionine-dependent methyltransferase [Gongronella butleri]|nr:S-adenosyl-L-methionine-dependent methyltransferase [Gongronella butleri]